MEDGENEMVLVRQRAGRGLSENEVVRVVEGSRKILSRFDHFGHLAL